MKDLLIILGCWSISFVFNGIEAGLSSIDPVRLRHHVKLNRPAAVRLDRLLKKPEQLLVTVLLVTNFADIVALLLLTRFFVAKFGAAGFALAIAIALPVYLFGLVVLPKSLFRRFPFRALSPLAGLLELSMAMLWPVLVAGAGITALLLGPRRRRRARLFAAREELKQITAQSEREGSLTSTERAMIHNVVDFQNITARDVMMPLSKVASLASDASIDDALALSRSTGFDRLPIINPGGETIGLVNILDILVDRNRGASLKSYIRRMVIVQENERADRAIQRLRAARLGLAAVIDLKQKPIGVVSSEDLIARLVRA